MGFTGFLAVQAGNVRQRSVDFRTWEAFGRIPFPRPSHDQQGRVADFLDTETSRIDALLARKRRMVDLLEERRVAITDATILREPGVVRPVAAFGSYLNGWAFAPDDFTATGLPVIRIAQLTDPSLETDLFEGDLPDRVRLRNGDIIFSWSASLEVHVWGRGPAYLNQHLYRVLPSPGIDRQWLRFALDAATRQFKGLMHGSAMTHITQAMMKLVRLPIPTEARQRELGAVLGREWAFIEEAVDRLGRQIVLLREHRQALVTAAVTGRLELADATVP